MRLLIFWALLLAIVSCAPALTDEWDPGDEQSQAWKVPERSCSRRPRIECPDGFIEGDVIIQESCAIFEDCLIIDGHVRIQGEFRNTGHVRPPERSREPGYVEDMRAQAPWGVILRRIVVQQEGRIGLYLATGVAETLVEDCSIQGTVYLDSESGYNDFRRVKIDARQSDREAVAVDSSDHNEFRDCSLRGGGFYFYRNQGEHGVTRITTPSYNLVTGCTVRHSSAAVWLGSRVLKRSYADDDAGADIGSSLSNCSFARGNHIIDNDFRPNVVVISSCSSGNTIRGN